MILKKFQNHGKTGVAYLKQKSSEHASIALLSTFSMRSRSIVILVLPKPVVPKPGGLRPTGKSRKGYSLQGEWSRNCQQHNCHVHTPAGRGKFLNLTWESLWLSGGPATLIAAHPSASNCCWKQKKPSTSSFTTKQKCFSPFSHKFEAACRAAEGFAGSPDPPERHNDSQVILLKKSFPSQQQCNCVAASPQKHV